MSRALRIGTRRSALALVQAEAVAAALRGVWQAGPVELVPIVTTGDRMQEQNPAVAGGRGLFVKELEAALLRGDIDLCVHSAKDVPPDLPEGLVLAAFPRRDDPRDALVGRGRLGDLPPGAVVATGSPRRAGQILHARPDLRVAPLRGNVDSRLRRVRAGEFDAAVLAVAGLQRLGLAEAIVEALDPEVMVPAAGQGALAVETGSDPAVVRAVSALDDAVTAFTVLAERAVLAGLGGGCAAPAGAFAEAAGGSRFRMRAAVCGAGGHLVIRACADAEVAPETWAPGNRRRLCAEAAVFAAGVVESLLRDGAEPLLVLPEGTAGAGEP